MSRPQTDYYRNSVQPRRPEVRIEWVEAVAAAPTHTERQQDGRLRCWGFVSEAGRWLRVVLEPGDGAILNAFFDRSFKPPQP